MAIPYKEWERKASASTTVGNLVDYMKLAYGIEEEKARELATNPAWENEIRKARMWDSHVSYVAEKIAATAGLEALEVEEWTEADEDDTDDEDY